MSIGYVEGTGSNISCTDEFLYSNISSSDCTLYSAINHVITVLEVGTADSHKLYTLLLEIM